MIEYIEVRDSTFTLIGVVDIVQSVIWKTEYYGCGEFEIFAKLTPASRELLKKGNYVSKPADNKAGIIESIEFTDDTDNGAMIAARGRMCKSLLDRRLCYQLSGHTITPVRVSGNGKNAWNRSGLGWRHHQDHHRSDRRGRKQFKTVELSEPARIHGQHLAGIFLRIVYQDIGWPGLRLL